MLIPTIPCRIKTTKNNKIFYFEKEDIITKQDELFHNYPAYGPALIFGYSEFRYIAMYYPKIDKFFQFLDSKTYKEAEEYRTELLIETSKINCSNCIHQFQYKLTKKCDETYITV